MAVSDDITSLVRTHPHAALALAVRDYHHTAKEDLHERARAAGVVASLASAANRPWVSLRYCRYRLKHDATFVAYNLAAATAFQCGRVDEARQYLLRALAVASPRERLASEGSLRRELGHCEDAIAKLNGPWGTRVRVITRSDAVTLPDVETTSVRLSLGRVNHETPPFNENWWGIGNDLLRGRRTFVDVIAVDGQSTSAVREVAFRVAARLDGVVWLPFGGFLIGRGPSIFFREARSKDRTEEPEFGPLIAATVYFERGELARARELIAEAQTLAPSSNEIAHWYSVIMGFKPD